MSRTRRTGPVEGFWATVDGWAADVVEPARLRAWWTSRCRLEASSGRYLDVTGDVPAGVRRLKDAVAATGVAVPESEVARSLEHRVVTEARRYRWNGPAMTPVALELHTTEDEAVVEAWWEDVWAAWPTIRLGRETPGQDRMTRRAIATAQINRLFRDLDMAPLQRLD
ncbi:MAG TPA: hypothetical protein VD926_15860 [Acidimicrobiales bacterium]|nr:hypothetical protein [Acidimicrobiales bacterium]